MPFDNVPQTETKPLTDAQKTLLKAAEIVRERGLCQGTFIGRDGSICTVEAIWGATRGTENFVPALRRFADFMGLGINRVAVWSDAPGRTAEEVASALERAALSSPEI